MLELADKSDVKFKSLEGNFLNYVIPPKLKPVADYLVGEVRMQKTEVTLISTLLRRKVIILRIEERFHQFDRILDDCHRFLGHLFECFAIFSDSIGQLYSFQVGPNEFIGIEFGGIRRDAGDPQPFSCFGTQKGTGFIRFMPARIVPNQ